MNEDLILKQTLLINKHLNDKESHFKLLEVPLTLFQDHTLLEKNFVKKMNLLHPDRHINKEAIILEEISRKSALLNRGFEILSSPIKTLEYILVDWPTVKDIETLTELIALSQKVNEVLSQKEEGEMQGGFSINGSLAKLNDELNSRCQTALQQADTAIKSQNWQEAARLLMIIRATQRGLEQLGV